MWSSEPLGLVDIEPLPAPIPSILTVLIRKLGGASSGVGVATTADAPIGSLIVVIVDSNPANFGVIGVSDSVGNTYVQAVQNVTTSGVFNTAIFYCSDVPNYLPAGATIAVTVDAGGSNFGFQAFAVNNANGGLDQTVSFVSGSANSISLVTGQLATASEIVFASANPSNTASALLDAIGFTTIEGGLGALGIMSDAIVNSVAPITYNPSWTQLRTIGAVLATFKAGRPGFLPVADGIPPAFYADFSNGKYWANNQVYGNNANWMTALSGSFSRSSSAYYTDATGKLVNAGSNVLRFDHDLNGNPLGLLLEGTETNSVQQSQVFSNPVWNHDLSVTITDNAATSPDGTSNATQLSITAAGGSAETYQNIALFGAALNTAISIYAKKGTNNFIALTMEPTGFHPTEFVCQVFDLNSGSLGESKLGAGGGTLVSSGIIDVGGGWYRIWMVASLPNEASPYISVQQANAATGNTFNASGSISVTLVGATVFVWQADFVQAGAISSPILTGAAASRSADLYVLAPGISVLNQSAGTALINWAIDNSATVVGSNFRPITAEVSSGSDDDVPMFQIGGSNAIEVVIDGSTAISVGQPATGNFRNASAWQAAGTKIAYNGAMTGTGGAATLTPDTRWIVGNRTAGDRAIFGHVSKLGYWPIFASDGAMQDVTR